MDVAGGEATAVYGRPSAKAGGAAVAGLAAEAAGAGRAGLAAVVAGVCAVVGLWPTYDGRPSAGLAGRAVAAVRACLRQTSCARP